MLTKSKYTSLPGQVMITLYTSLALAVLTLTISGCGSSGGLDETASITLTPDSSSINADGVSSVSITAYVTDSAGLPVLKYTDVLFKTDNGYFRNGSQTYKVPTVSASGTATVSLISSNEPGIAEVSCESSGVTQSIRIHFLHYDNSGLPVAEEFGLSVEYHNLSGLWLAGLENTIWAHLGDEFGNAVEDGIPVSFKTYNTGGFFDPDTAVTAGMIDDTIIHGPGTASSTLFTTPNPAPAQGMVSVTAETDGGSTTHITSIAVTPGFDSHIMYAGTNGGGVYKSTDSGRHWDNISRSTLNPRSGQNWIAPYVKGNRAIAVDPDDHNMIYVGTGYLGQGNLFRSLDGGMNWNSNDVEQWNGLYSTNTAVLSVLCDDNGSDYVWMGTEGQGILYADDGETFQPSGGIVNVNSLSGKGEIVSPKVGYDAKTETWTLTCFVPDATVNAPSIFTDIDPFIDPIAFEEDPYAPPPVLTSSNPDTDGRIGSFSTSSSTLTEEWTAKYTILDAEAQNIEHPENKGTVIEVESRQTTTLEHWTLTCGRYNQIGVENLVTPNGKGTVDDVESRQTAPNDHWTLTCIYVDIDAIPLLGASASAIFTVESSLSGRQANAELNAAYTSEIIDFTIIPGQAPFVVGDVIEFDTVYTDVDPLLDGDPTIFTVVSSLTGRQADATVNSPYTSEKIDFTIIQGQLPFIVGDVIEFDTIREFYWQVRGSVSGQQAGTTVTGANYTSDNGEVGFRISAGKVPFSHGDYFTFYTFEARPAYWTVEGSESGMQAAIAQTGQIYKSDNDEISFTIEDSGSAFNDGDQFKLVVIANKISHGWSVWDFVKVPGTHGESAILYAATATGLYKSTTGGRTWDGTGRFTGDYITCLDMYHTASGEDIIYAGTQNAGVWVSSDSGDTWVQYVNGMEKGTNIKDILLDSYNQRLYAVTWYAPRESASGRIFVSDVTEAFTMPDAAVWNETAQGLSGAAMYAIAADDSDASSELYVGGEGISFYRTTGPLDIDLPEWQESGDGLSNRIMARIPVLFSGEAVMSYETVQYDNIVFLTVYIQDINGNPPIAGSTYSAAFHSDSDSEGGDFTWDDLTYPDTYTHRGTYSDPGNGYTNNPYRYITSVASGDEITLTYTPTCGGVGVGDTTNSDTDRGAGCSGSEQTITIAF